MPYFEDIIKKLDISFCNAIKLAIIFINIILFFHQILQWNCLIQLKVNFVKHLS